MELFQQFIMPTATVICAVAFFVLKTAINRESFDRFIPLCSAILGLVIVAWASQGFTPEIVAQGLVSGLAATGCYELIKNFIRLAGEGKNDQGK